MEKRTSQINYKWVILATCFLMEFLCLGFCSSNVGLYTKAVTEALNIKRSVYSLSSSIRYITQVITALYFGKLIARLGVRKMVGLGLTGFICSVLIRAFATQFYHLYIGSVFWGIGIVFAGGSMAATIVRRWFHQDVGRYTGIVMSANGIGGAIAAQIISPIINNGEVFGYRKAYLLSAAIAFVIAVLVIVFLRDNPSDPAPASANGKKKPKGAIWEGLPYERIKKKPYFYITAAMVFITGISLASVGSITLVYMADLGLPDSFIAIYATLSSLFLTFSKLFVGACYDKRGLRFTMLICQISAVVSFVLKLILSNSTQGMVFAIIAVVLTALASPMETVIIPLLTGDLFGLASYDKVLGIMGAANSLGLCLGSFLGDLTYDVFGTYIPCFLFFIISMIAVIFGYRFVFRASSADKKAVLEETT